MDATIITILIATFAALFGVYKYIVARGDKRRQELKETADKRRQELKETGEKQRSELKESHGQILDEHKARLDRHSGQISKLYELVKITREEMHDQYTKTEDMIRLEGAIGDQMKEMFSRMNAMARDLNQAIGEMKATNEAEVKDLIKEIKNAVIQTNKP